MNKQQSQAPSFWHPRQPRECGRPLRGSWQGCRAPVPPLSFALSCAEGSQDCYWIVNTFNLFFSSTMSRLTLLHICVAFCSVLFLSLATKCLAFPRVERREIAHAHAEKEQSQKMSTDDQGNLSFAPKYMPQQMSSQALMGQSAGPSVTPLNKVFSVNKETHLPRAGPLQPTSPDLYSSSEPVVSASEQEQGLSQLERVSPEHRLSEAMLTMAVSSPASLNPEEEESYSSSSPTPTVEGITDVTHNFLKYVDNQLFSTESQDAVSLGNSPSSYIYTKEMLTTNPRTEKAVADVAKRTTEFPGIDSTRDTEHDGERPSDMTADGALSTATKHLVEAPQNSLAIKSTAGSLPGKPKGTVSVSTAAPVSSVPSDEWDDTKFESVSQMRLPETEDNAETQVRTEPPYRTYMSFEGTQGSPTSKEVPKVPGGETPLGTAPVTAVGGERSPVFTYQILFTPTRLTEDPKVSTVTLTAGGFTASTQEDRAMLFSETAVSTSQYEFAASLAAGNVLTDITQEMTVSTREPDTTLPLVTQEHRSAMEVSRGSGEPEEAMPSSSSASAYVGATELSRRWESLPTPASTTAVPLSLEVSSSMEDLMDTITGPTEEFIPVLDSPMAAPTMTVEVPTVSPALHSEGRTVQSISHPNTAASFGLEELESEEVEDDEDEEDEEDEEEEEEDEEDEEDKEADSLYKDFDGDTELPGFTLPGITSQEPDIESGGMDLLEVATYQVPETIEWEQRNRGLVRSWMEKLKDKAGYMSGMLVPVGVGIAGALFILGALYSIKVMNRRRRNGFKRHKRKQREFNSMQDRVMLLADSSEDEF
ncbi:armadillo-like helical domain-containing protein 4 isoform X2 [Meriones unguiculatus]|uniref:armadillo-like helical domain-containing protein 4 isoform X2 n=1 Tax=Meriones unguiculatus TaxID=10047 RepID=UPI00293EFF0E|nr:armadillo-like helical domain-containing protein 4 isoform X2 [Meriones unguiculatus]